MLQETKLYKEGKIKLEGFVIFEKHRKYKGGGGLLTAIHENFKPILVQDDDENADMMVVDVKLDSKISARTINCYGPQEFSRKKKSAEGEAENTDPQPDKKIFFQKLQTEIQNAKSAGHLLCIQMDANSKFGREIIPNDPSLKMSENGKILYDIIKTEDLILVNSSNKCLGTITRYRKTTKTN